MAFNWWLLLGLSGGLLVAVSLFEIAIFFQAPWPAIKETEAEFGEPMPNRNLTLMLMLGRPCLSIAVGLGAAVAAFHKLT